MATDLADYNRRSFKHGEMLDHPMEQGLSLWELKHIRDAANHSYWCDCPQCLRWWTVRYAVKRPREDGSRGNPRYMGPFSWDTIETAHRVRCWERVCERMSKDGRLEMFVFFDSPSKPSLDTYAYLGGGDWQHGSDFRSVIELDIAFIPRDIEFSGAVAPVMAGPTMIARWHVYSTAAVSFEDGTIMFRTMEGTERE